MKNDLKNFVRSFSNSKSFSTSRRYFPSADGILQCWLRCVSLEMTKMAEGLYYKTACRKKYGGVTSLWVSHCLIIAHLKLEWNPISGYIACLASIYHIGLGVCECDKYNSYTYTTAEVLYHSPQVQMIQIRNYINLENPFVKLISAS
jgi:hypothetical protein